MSSLYIFEEGVYTIEEQASTVSLHEAYSPLDLPASYCHGQKVDSSHQVSVHIFPDESQRAVIVSGDIWDGEMVHTSSGGQLLFRCYYQNNLLHGPSRYYQNNFICCETWYWKGKKNGKAAFFYNENAPYATLYYKGGYLHGECRYWYPNGELKTILHYNLGKIVGKVQLF